MPLIKKLLIGIIILAAGLRLFYLAELSHSPFFRHPVLDAQYYSVWAQKLAWGNFSFVRDCQGNPLYPYFLAVFYRLWGPNPFSLRLVQHALGLLTCLLIFWIGKTLFTFSLGLLAALIYAIYLPAIFYEGWFISASLDTFLTTALAADLLYSREKAGKLNWLLCGLLAGLLTLARPSLIPFGALLWIIIRPRTGTEGRAVKAALLFLAGLLGVLLLYALYYRAHQGEWVLVSPHGGENFYIGNNPQANGVSSMPEFARGLPSVQHEDFRAEASRRSGRELSPEEASRFWFGEGVKFIIRQPARFIKLFLLKIFLFFSGTELSDNYHLVFFRNQLLLLRILLPWRILSLLGILGMIIAWKNREQFSLLYIFTACYVFSIALYFVVSRLRLSLAPIFCLFAAGLINYCYKINLGRLLALTIAGVALFFLLGWPPQGTSPYSFLISAAEVHHRDGEFQKSLSYLQEARRALKKEPPNATAPLYRLQLALGQTHLALGDQDKAAETFCGLLSEKKWPRAELNLEIGNAYAEYQHYDQAIKHYRLTLAEEANNLRALNNLGLSLKAEGRITEAESCFKKAVEIKPDYAAAHGNLGNLYSLQGKYEEAAGEYEAALRSDPSLTQFHLSRAFCLENTNHPAEAQIEYQKCPAVVRRYLKKQKK